MGFYFIQKNMKKSYYFSHDYNARNDEKLQRLMQKHWMSWVGIFWCIVEMLYEQDWYIQEDYDCIAFVLHEECERIKSVIQDFWLFIINDWKITSKTVSDRIWYMKQKSQKAKESAEEGRKKRNAFALQTHSKGNANKVKENKVKESKEKYIKEIYNKTLSNDKEEQSSFWDSDINEVFEIVKSFNDWITDDPKTPKSRWIWRNLINKVMSIEKVINWNYSRQEYLRALLTVVSKNSYHRHKISWVSKIYYNLAELIQIANSEFDKQKEKEDNRPLSAKITL